MYVIAENESNTVDINPSFLLYLLTTINFSYLNSGINFISQNAMPYYLWHQAPNSASLDLKPGL